MEDKTIANTSPVGRHLGALADTKPVSYLMFNKKKIQLVAKISIGRESDNDIVVDNKLASRHHAIIQKIKDGKAHEISEADTMYLGACTFKRSENS